MQKTKPVGMNIPVDPLRFSTWSTFNGTIIATSTEKRELHSRAGGREGIFIRTRLAENRFCIKKVLYVWACSKGDGACSAAYYESRRVRRGEAAVRGRGSGWFHGWFADSLAIVMYAHFGSVL